MLVQFVTFSKFLSSVGGIMALVAGVSVLSVVEIFFHLARSLRPTDNQVHAFAQPAPPAASESHILRQLTRYFVEFLRSSSVHGLRYTQGRRHSRCVRIFWAVQVVVSAALCSVLVRDIYKHAEKSPVITSIDAKTMTLDEIPFPSVVICPDTNSLGVFWDMNCVYYGNDCFGATREEV